MFYLLLDILIYNFTPYLSYFFLLNLNNKSYIYNLSIAILIDFGILHIYFYNVILITVLYLVRKYLFKFNYHNFNYYWLINMGIVTIYYLLSSFIFSEISLYSLLNLLIINGIFIAISYKSEKINIKCFR